MFERSVPGVKEEKTAVSIGTTVCSDRLYFDMSVLKDRRTVS